MRPTRRMLAALLPLGVLPLAACSTALSPTPGAAYGTSSSGSAPASPTASASASPSGGTSATSAKTLLIVEKTMAGYVLATGTGRTVYWYGKDARGSGKSACTAGCLSAWPAVTGKPYVGPGVKLAGKLGSITRPDGTVQATYNGYPLYTYAAGTATGNTSGNGEGGVWHDFTGTALTATQAQAGADAVASKKAMAQASGTPAPSASGSSGSPGGSAGAGTSTPSAGASASPG
ncbi:MAG: hypothetical protein J2P25_13345 [Nocardiopsaceae bacterium]|nr:hypothetical protein [Nocardiopsaceae bacterium]